MQIHELIQGSDEWHQFRLEHFGASEAAAMLGLSKKVKRNELLHMKHTGTAKEFSDWVQANILDYGHEVEAMARPMVEAMIGEDMYPVTCSEGMLSASCDGLTMSEEIAFEHKQWNEKLAESVAAGVLPEEYQPQCQQIMLVTGAKKVIFVVSNGTPDRFVWMGVHPDPAWFERLRAGWNQFASDLAEYQPVEVLPAAVAAPTMGLPALSIQVDGSISLISNLDVFGAKLTAFVESIDKNPSDDQAFADCEAAVKVLQKAQDALEAAEASALAQTSSIDEMRRTVAMYSEMARTNRLMLEKLVKARKETIRIEIQQGGRDKAAAHIAALNQRLGKPYMPAVPADFAGVMKGKKTISSLRDAVDTELARFKIEANAIADRIQFNLTTLRELAGDHKFLFADVAQIVLKATDDCTALIKLRIAEHKAAEEKRLSEQREKIAAEERRKAEEAVRGAARQQAVLGAAQARREEDDDEAERVRLQDAADQMLADAREPAMTLAEVLHAVAPPEVAQAICPTSTVTLRFEGNSDDTFGECAHFKDDFDNCASGKPIEYLVAHRESGTGLIVTGQFAPGSSGGWMIGVANWDPDAADTDFPRWPIHIEAQNYRNGFNPSLVIEAPAGVTLTCLQRVEDKQAA